MARRAHDTIPLLATGSGPIPLPDPAARLGAYQVLAPLAKGGMCDVYLGAHLLTGERVAIKVLDPDLASDLPIVARLLAEREVSERVQHPGLVDVRCADRSAQGTIYLVMEYLDGENLNTLAERGPMVPGAIAAIGTQIADALDAMHAAGVVHGDIKPDNVVVLYEHGISGWPRIKVIDFGVSKILDKPEIDDGSIAGTPSYMPPEQWRGQPGAKSDVYALGCLLYEIATGVLPFSGPLPKLMLAHVHELPKRPSQLREDLPPALDRLIVRALAKDPEMRPTMREMRDGLEMISILLPGEAAEVLEATG
jgi:eukaryotic-like serine/threonine-protein kinase